MVAAAASVRAVEQGIQKVAEAATVTVTAVTAVVIESGYAVAAAVSITAAAAR